MAVNLNALAEVQTVGSNQNMLLFGDNNVATRIDYDKLAEAILNKTRDEIGGVSPISAIAALNSRSMRYFPVAQIPQGADLDTIYSGNYYCNTNTLHQTILHKPFGVATIWRLHVISITNDGESNPSTMNAWMKRIQILEDETGVVFQRTIKGTGSTFPVIGEWEKLPTRAEVDALNSRLTQKTGGINTSKGVDMHQHKTYKITMASGEAYPIFFMYGQSTGSDPFAMVISAGNMFSETPTVKYNAFVGSGAINNVTASNGVITIEFDSYWVQFTIISKHKFTDEIV